ncbi:PAS domain-containing protein, partial [Oleiphilus sp. HI0117]
KNPAHQRSMLEKLTSTYQTNITVGPRTFNLIATPIFAENKERIGTVVEWNDRTEALAQETKAKQLAEENAGVRLALDVCNTNVMMADANYNINYMNKAVQNMMRVAEADLRKVLPNFDANNLVGNNIDVFHKNPAHQRSMLERLTSTYQTEIKVGVRTFGLTATPIYGEDQTR